MSIKISALRGEDNETIVGTFIDHVTKTDEEISEEGRKEIRHSTELKIYIAANEGFDPRTTDERIENLVRTDDLGHHPQKYFSEHNFTIEQLNEEIHHLVISTPKYERDDEFILIDTDGYVKALTTIRKTWAEDTIEKFIQYIPELDRLFVSSSDLESVVDSNDKRDLTGFTAKYKPYYKDQEVSIQFHGGTDEHLRQVEEKFNARPKRIVFSQRNSPAEAVKGTINQDGYASIPRVREGSEDVGYDAINEVISKYQTVDKENFRVDYRPQRLTPGHRYFLKQLTIDESVDEPTDGGFPDELKDIDQGSVLEGVTVMELEEEVGDSDYPNDTVVADYLEDEILDYKNRYSYSKCGVCNFLVYDRDRGESFEIIIEDRNIRVYAKANTTRKSLRDFYQIIDGEFNSTYRVDNSSVKVRA